MAIELHELLKLLCTYISILTRCVVRLYSIKMRGDSARNGSNCWRSYWRSILKDLKLGTLPDPVELSDSQLDMVAGGRAHGFVKKRNSAAPDPIGNGGTANVTSSGGSASVGTDNIAMSDSTPGSESMSGMSTGSNIYSINMTDIG